MNTCYSSRSTRLARLFSFGLLDGPPWITLSRTGRLTISAARTDVARFIQRAVRPARSLWEGARLGAPGVGGWHEGFGLSRFATAFMNNPG